MLLLVNYWYTEVLESSCPIQDSSNGYILLGHFQLAWPRIWDLGRMYSVNLFYPYFFSLPPFTWADPHFSRSLPAHDAPSPSPFTGASSSKSLGICSLKDLSQHTNSMMQVLLQMKKLNYKRSKKQFYSGPEVLELGFDLRQSDIKTSYFKMSIKRQEIKL